MYNDVGKKIKSLAFTITLLGIVISIILGISMLADENIWGLVVMLAGALLSYYVTLLLYGIGELIDKVCEISKNTEAYFAMMSFEKMKPNTIDSNEYTHEFQINKDL